MRVSQRMRDWMLFLLLIVWILFRTPTQTVEAQAGTGTVTTIADITGTGAAVQVAASGNARWIQFIAPSTNAAAVRCGDVNVSTTRGLPLAAGAGQFLPFQAQLYNLPTLYCYIANGDKLSIAWGN